MERDEKYKEGWTAYLYHLKPLHFKNKTLNYFFENNIYLLKQYEDIIKKGSVLYIGHGNGHTVYSISLWNKDVIGIDVIFQKNALSQDKMIIYDGKTIPFEDNYFDTVICNYTLHHIKIPEETIKEIIRVSKENIIIMEETYDTLPQKIKLVFNDWFVNKKAGQSVTIFWHSYFSRAKIRSVFQENNLQVKKELSQKRKGFWKELFVLKKQ